MKKLLPLFVILILFCVGCTRLKNTQVEISQPDSEQVTETILEVAVEPEQASVIEETQEKKQFVGITMLDEIDFILNNKHYVNVGSDDEKYSKHIGYFEFLSRESIQWYSDTSGPRHFPRLYIIDENNLRIEVFRYYGPAEEVRKGNYCSTNKYYIDISKYHLTDYRNRIKRQIDTYVVTEYFKANITEEQEKERGGFFFEVLRDSPLYADSAMQRAEHGTINTGNMVRVIDMHYKDFSDRYPVALKVEIENLSGWVDLESIDFILNTSGN